MPSHGSQVRKTNNEKELVLVRAEKNGIPVYFVVALLEMAELVAQMPSHWKKILTRLFKAEMFLC